MTNARAAVLGSLVNVVLLAGPPIAILHGNPDGRNEAGSATLVDPTTLKRLASITVGVRPSAGAFDESSGRLVVANAGDWSALPAGLTGEHASVSIVDVATFRRLGDVSIPGHLGGVVVPAGDGAYVATASGARGGQSVAHLIDRATLQLKSTLPLGTPMYVGRFPEFHRAFAAPSGRTVFVLRSPTIEPGSELPFRGASNVAAELALIDPSAGTLRETRRLAPRLVSARFSDDRRYVYLFCLGDSRGPGSKTSRPSGRIYVLDAESGAELLAVDAGYGSPRLVPDASGDVYLLVPKPATGSPHVALIRGAGVVARLDAPGIMDVASIPGTPERLVLCERELLLADAGLARVSRRLQLPFDAGEIVVAGDGSRAWILERSGSKFGAVPLPGLGGFRAFTSGRPEIKLGKAAATVATGALLVAGAVIGYVGPVYVPRRSDLAVVPSADGRLVHVYNRRTEDDTVVDVSSMTILDRDGVGDGKSTVLLPLLAGPGMLAIWDDGQAVLRLDDKNAVEVRRLPDLGGDAVAPAIPVGSEVWVVRKGGFQAISLQDGAVRGSIAVPRTTGAVVPELPSRGSIER